MRPKRPPCWRGWTTRRALAHRPLDDERLRWVEYTPRPRPGAWLADLGRDARKAAHRLLATAGRSEPSVTGRSYWSPLRGVAVVPTIAFSQRR
jgi:hypothetical protein